MSRKAGIIIAAGLLLTAGIIFAAARVETPRPPQIETVTEEEEEALPEVPVPSRAEQVIKALAAAYPWRVERAEFRNGTEGRQDDWALLMDGVWYYYAGGRMLPENLLGDADLYTGAMTIYNYQSELPPWREPTPEQAARYRSRDSTPQDANRNNNNSGSSGAPRVQRQRSHFFFEGVWQASSGSESSRRVKTIRFFNYSLVVHADIVPVLAEIEEIIMAAAESDPQLKSWVNGIGEVHGWSWRNVSGSASRSYHSYGIAVDILPRNLNGKETYWQWSAQNGREWWNVPYEDRYHPPDTVIKTFESYGFVWGGKWAVFDTMHFEFRPEVFILSGLPLRQVQTMLSIP